MDEKTQRCVRNTKGQAEIRTIEPVANGFLRTKILPKLRAESKIHVDKTAKLQKDFYQSLLTLAKHYQGFTPSEDPLLAYPYNISFSLSETKNFLKCNVRYWNDLKIVQDKTKTFLITEERFSTGATLYYIPIIPLFLMLKDKYYKRTAHILLSVCSYLYHIADIPYYRQEGSYLYWQYEMLREWMETDDEFDFQESYLKEFTLAGSIGDWIEKKLYNLKNLDFFENRLQKFNANNSFQKECIDLALSAFRLHTQYPNEKYSRNAHIDHSRLDDEEMDDYEENNVVEMNMYVSFYAHSRGRLSENLYDTLNMNFGEMGKIEEPTVFKVFDGSSLTNRNLDFEEQLFDIIDNLIYLLNKYNDDYYGKSN
ncbi:hypothetical protein ATE47_01455 [Chryseobacterium sp. IHB B 17019]|nr:hypothetical protein ATE47_01455 [Chryseobacterium sp. IHB B 17019]